MGVTKESESTVKPFIKNAVTESLVVTYSRKMRCLKSHNQTFPNQGDIFTYPVAIDGGAVTNAFQVGGIPAAYVIDAQGTIVWQGRLAVCVQA